MNIAEGMKVFRKGEFLFKEGAAVKEVILVIRGKVLLQNACMRMTLGADEFVGISDLYAGVYQSSCMAIEDLQACVFPASDPSDLKNIALANKDYRGLMVSSMGSYIQKLNKSKENIRQAITAYYQFLKTAYQLYREIGIQQGCHTQIVAAIEQMEPWDEDFDLDGDLAEYYDAVYDIPVHVQKLYYAYGSQLSLHFVNEAAQTAAELMQITEKLGRYVSYVMKGMMSKENECLFFAYNQTGNDLHTKGIKDMRVYTIMKEAILRTQKLAELKERETGSTVSVSLEAMKAALDILMINAEQTEANTMQPEDEETVRKRILTELHGSLDKLLNYSGIEKEKQIKFKELLEQFAAMPDKYSTENEARILRTGLSKIYYQIYEAVFLKAFREKAKNRIINMFLNFGFMDERLLSEDELIQLYQLSSGARESGPCRVYTISEWLTAICQGKKEPSKSEFDLDYGEMIKEKRKQNTITEAEAKAMEKNQLKKLEYELQNMLAYNSRIISGQISTFMPVLHSGAFFTGIMQSYTTAEKVNEVIKELVAVDYSIFYRETMYNHPEKKIQSTYVMQEIYPDIILLPVCGSNGVMWQEIEGKRRNSHARFLLPAFALSSVNDMLLKLFGRYRWEFCRMNMGVNWNNIKYPSLTAEYSDYIQFYRKNRDLTEERREKLKFQIQKAHGNTREIFVMDYALWMEQEAKGSIRLNKVARAVLATYCPFARETRNQVIKQPLFADAYQKFQRENIKQMKLFESRIYALQKAAVEVPEEFAVTLAYYKDL